ncbi:hypothetical protein [Tsukamurella sp. NPDC003166]|uniref:hypothetical protein n=1 Tax=Tsukamurella sp. NPDC003166 TaxID=3154444 RepID=UPI0033B1A795
MICTRPLAAAGFAALLAAGGCSNDGAQTSPSATSTTVTNTTTAQQDPSPRTAQPSATVTVQPTRRAPTTIPKPPKPTGPGSEYDVPCTGGPGEGTICTNPNHGAGDDPYGTGSVAPTPSKPR